MNRDPVFWVVRNPRAPHLALVSWDVLDSRSQAVVSTFATQALATADMVAKNDAL